MQVQIIIVGLGISGTWLSYFLSKKNISFLVIDEGKQNASSRVAAGIINPVTGRRVARTWLIEELMPFAWDMYNQIGNEVGGTVISKKKIIEFFSAPDVKIAFDKKMAKGEPFLSPYNHPWPEDTFQTDFGCGMIDPAYVVHLETLLPAWKNKLKAGGRLLEEYFDTSLLAVSEKEIVYKDVKAEKIIFCDGVGSARSPFFSNLPFAINKGEALWLEIKNLPDNFIYKKGLSLVPACEKDVFWLGASYQWDFDNDQPDEAFRKEAEYKVKKWLKLPFRIVDHKAALRPSTVERRPLVGFHPLYKNVGLLNGMGTKGCSLAPYFAKQLTDHIAEGLPLLPESSVGRFQKILSQH